MTSDHHDLKFAFAVNTHLHADHITGTGLLKKLIPSCKSVISYHSGAKADLYVNHGDDIEFGKYKLRVRLTPGHTSGKNLYTGLGKWIDTPSTTKT